MVIWDIIFYKWKLLCVKEIKLCLKANYCFGQENFWGFWWVLEWECWWREVYTWDSVNYFLFQWNLFLFNFWVLFPISKVFLTRYLEIQEASNTVSKPSWAPVIWTCDVSHFPNLGKKSKNTLEISEALTCAFVISQIKFLAVMKIYFH